MDEASSWLTHNFALAVVVLFISGYMSTFFLCFLAQLTPCASSITSRDPVPRLAALPIT